MISSFVWSNDTPRTGWVIICIATVAYAALVLALVVKHYRQPAGARSMDSLTGIVYTLVGGILAAFVAYGSSVLVDERAPESNLEVFVEQVSFGVPPLSTKYLGQVTAKEIQSDLRELSESEEEFVFSQYEATQITRIARNCGQAEGITAGAGYSGKEIADRLTEAMYFYSAFYRDSPTRLDALAAQLEVATEEDRAECAKRFVNEVLPADISNSMLLSSAIGSAARGDFIFPELGEKSLPAPVYSFQREYMGTGKEDGTLYVEFDNWRLKLESDVDAASTRSKVARSLSSAITSGKIKTLAQFFHLASAQFSRSGKALKEYVELFDALLQSRKGSRVRLQMTISNMSKYDSFIRNVGKLGIGSKADASAPILLQIKAAEVENSKFQQPFLRIPTRSAESFTFSVALSKDEQDKVFGAYKSGLTYLRAAVQASIGESESIIVSPITPFSTEANKRALNRIQEFVVPLTK